MAKKLVKFIFRLVNLIFPFSGLKKVISIKTTLHTLWVTPSFKSVGKNAIIRYPLSLRGGENILLGNNIGIGTHVVLSTWPTYKNDEAKYEPSIIINDNCSIGDFCHFTSINRIEIGENVLIGRMVLISDHAHGNSDEKTISVSPVNRNLYSKGPIVIEKNVWIGDKVTILSDVIIGENSIIGANSVVTKNIPKNSIAVGAPAIIVKKI